MHEIQTIVTDDFVCQSVSLSVRLLRAASVGFGIQKRLNDLSSCLE